ncbi:CPSF A subunit region-domain-containing protein [Mycena olivaceomarginata]|nr:CPSF A subunit region-domain-containing protein [Mycena olivaceomarginata]
MDVGGESSKSQTVTRIYFVREHSLHGIITGVEGIQVMASIEDKLDRLLVSFKDAKIALMEWSDTVHDLVTVSIHTYERAPQLISMDSSSFKALLRVDPSSRCAALSLPKDAIAILPFYQTQADLDVLEQEQALARDVPYSPSFILDLTGSVDENMSNLIDFVFLPGYNNPTMAVLFQTQQTWTGRLKEYKDTVKIAIFTLDIVGQHYPIISSVSGLPYDSISLLPCSASLGGVVVLTSNSIIYVDRSSRRIALPLNGWAARITDISMPPEDQSRNLALEGARAVFADDKTIFVILKDGTVHPLVSKLVMGPPLAQTTVPEVARRLNHELVFVGSSVGPSILFRAARVEEEIEPDGDVDMHAVAQVDEPMDVYNDDDDDIYGPSKTPDPLAKGLTNGARTAKKTRTVTHLSLCDTLEAYGSIADMTFSLAWNGDRAVAELVAATGTGPLGGFTLFQRDLPIRTKRKLHALGGARGMWSLPIRPPPKTAGSTPERPFDSLKAENDSLIISTDVNPSPGLSRLAHRGPKNDVTISVRIPGTTIGAGAFFQHTAILHVTTNAIRVLEPDGTERQIIKDVDGSMPRPKIRACSISDPYIIVIREDDSIGMFIETDRGRIRRKDMSSMGDKSSRYLTGCFFADPTGLFDSCLESAAVPNSAVSVEKPARSKWLVLVRPQGVVEIWTLPKLTLVFSTSLLATLQNVITDSHQPPTPSPPEDPPRKPQDLDIEQILVAPLGESSPKPHLFVFLRSGQLAIYEVAPGSFIKSFEIQRPDEAEKSIIAEQKRISRQFIPFSLWRIFTGDRPSWILATNKSCVKILPSGHSVVHAFTQCSLWDSQGDFLLYSEEGPSLLEWLPDLNLDTPLPSKSVPRGRSYSNVAKFASFDEDGNRIWEPDAPNVGDPLCDCSCLELISPDLWITMDGTETGSKEFIAVGTTINRGEDLAAKGSTYVFEIVEVVPDPALAPKRWYKLRLRFRDDAKDPTIFVRAFDDDRLVGVAFLDVGVYVTSLRTLKNLLLVGDAVKSIMFVAFQEDPYKLVILAKDLNRVCVTSAEFFFAEGEMSIVTSDEEGVIRMYEYNPNDPESKDGRFLLLRTEFHGQIEYRTSTLVARRAKEEVIPQAKLICGMMNTCRRIESEGPPVSTSISLPSIVRNDFVSKPLSKGILDGNLLSHFENLPITRQNEMTRQIGTERMQVLKDWISLAGAW